MAAVTITAIEFDDNEVVSTTGQCGIAWSLGDAVYFDSSDSKWKPADADASEAAAGKNGIGIALHAVSTTDEWGIILLSGRLFLQTLGASAKGGVFVVGNTPGAIHPVADLASGWYSTVLGIGGVEGGTGLDEFLLQPIVSGKAVA